MKAIHGLILAIGLGIGGALFNFAYLTMKSKDVAKVQFVGIKSGVGRGERLKAEDLVPVGVPERWIGNLNDFAVRYVPPNRGVVGSVVRRTLPAGTLLLEEDLDTPSQEFELGVDEAAIGVPVDVRTFVPSLIVPGALVSFIVSKAPLSAPTRAERPEETGFDEPEIVGAEPPAEPAKPIEPTGLTETLGKFKVLSLGNRFGTADVMKAARIPQRQENVMTISVKVTDDGKLADPKAQKLVDLLYATNFRKVGIILYTPKNKSN